MHAPIVMLSLSQRRFRSLGLICCVLFLWGCGVDEDVAYEEIALDPGVEDRTPYEQLELASDTSEGFTEHDEPVPVIPVQGEQGPADVTVSGPLTVTGELRPAPGYARPPAAVTITAAGPGTQVLMRIDGYPPGTTLVPVLVRGLCDERGEVLTRIREPLTVGPGGLATITEQVQLPTRPMLDGRHSVRLITPGRDDLEAVLACADLPVVEGLGR